MVDISDAAAPLGARLEASDVTRSKAPTDRPTLFRGQALDAYLRSDVRSALLHGSGRWHHRLLAALATLVVVAVATASLVRVEVTSRGPAVLRPAGGGPRTVIVQVSGPVLEVTAHTGDLIAAGDPILRIDSTAIRRESIDTNTQLAVTREALTRLETVEDRHVRARLALYDEQSTFLGRRVTSEGATIQHLQTLVGTYDSLSSQGAVATSQRDEVAERLAQAFREKVAVQEQIASVQSQRASLQAQHESDVSRAKWELENAEAKMQDLQVALEQTTVRGTEAGTVEALLVHPGDILQAGASVARVVPDEPPAQVIAFVPERDRAYLQVGASARIELDQFPLGESGPLRATVTRISRDLATARDVRDSLGDDARLAEPVYRIDLDLVDDATHVRLGPLLRTGMLGTARVVLRKRRVLGIVFSPLRAWLE